MIPNGGDGEQHLAAILRDTSGEPSDAASVEAQG